MSEQYAWSTPEVIKSLSREPFGETLMNQVADKLEHGPDLAYYHRDYCGLGLKYVGNGKFIVNKNWDYGIEENLLTWNSRNDFISFMAMQSDYSLSGADKKNKELFESDSHKLNNQRITRERLQDFVNQ